MGTPSYMAPEQARGEVDRLDERCDVFALGSILCEVLTGEPAFTGRSSGEIQRKASRGDLKDAIDRLDACGADAELIALAKDCLAPELEDRPRHAGEVAARINAYQTGVQERLRQAEIARAEEKARAEEATKRARVERDRLRLTVALAASVLGSGRPRWRRRVLGRPATTGPAHRRRSDPGADSKRSGIKPQPTGPIRPAGERRSPRPTRPSPRSATWPRRSPADAWPPSAPRSPRSRHRPSATGSSSRSWPSSGRPWQGLTMGSRPVGRWIDASCTGLQTLRAGSGGNADQRTRSRG